MISTVTPAVLEAMSFAPKRFDVFSWNFGSGPRKHSLALGAVETSFMVGVSKGRHHLSLNELSTEVALDPKQTLVVFHAVVRLILRVETTRCQRLLTLCNATALHRNVNKYTQVAVINSSRAFLQQFNVTNS